MDPNRLTQRSAEALQEAQSIAARFGHTEVDGEHLLLALLEQPEGLVPRLVDASGADAAGLRSDIEGDLARRPRVSGPGAAPGQVFLTSRLSRLLDAADAEARRLKDEYVSVEHLMLALIAEGPASPSGRYLRAGGWTGTGSWPRSVPSGATNASHRLPRRGPTRPWASTARTLWPAPGPASSTP